MSASHANPPRPPGVTRRRFIGVTAGAAAGAWVGWQGGGSLARMAAAIDRPIRPPGGPESFVLSVCRECPGGCGVSVRCIGGRPVKVAGNPLHPVNSGRLCPRGQAGLQSLYHPDRLRGPLRRVGPRGSLASFQPASWVEALDEISLRLSLLRQQGRPEALALLRGSGRGLGPRLASRFLEAFGSPNDIVLPRGDEACSQALHATQGVRAVPAYDLPSAEYALSFGSALLEASSAPVHTLRAFGKFREGRDGRRGKLVHAGPRLSITGTSADEWLAVRPGTEGTLALGIAAVLVAEDLYDKEFVSLRSHQFEDYADAQGVERPGLRALLQRDFGLERVSAETGVSVNRILRVAREFAAARPGLAVGPRLGPLLSGRLFDHLAVHVLNGLAGNVDAPGGVLVPDEVPLPAWPELAADAVAEQGRARTRLDGAGPSAMQAFDPERFAQAMLAREPYKIEALLLLDADPLFASLDPEAFAAALEAVPLVVSFASLADDSSLFADWILPQAHAYESWDLHPSPPGVPHPLASLSAPAVAEPLHDVRPAAQVILELARRLGGPLARALPWSDSSTLIRSQVGGLFEAQRGAVIGTEFDEAWVRLMERAGWWAPGYRTEPELWNRIRETGGWWDPFYDHWHWKRVLRTPSGRFEFRPDLLRELEEERRARLEIGRGSRGRVGASERGLALSLFEPLAIAGGTGAESPFLEEILEPREQRGWHTWVEIHPETAAELGVASHDLLRLSTPYGSVRAVAHVTADVVSDVAALPVGLGKRAGGRWARGVGANPLRLLAPVREAHSGLPDPGATRVRVAVEGRVGHPAGAGGGLAAGGEQGEGQA